jgi:hypothetical protein
MHAPHESSPSQLLTLLLPCFSVCVPPPCFSLSVHLSAVPRHRLSRALTAWHASDGSARILLGPWAKVFEAQDWENLMSRCILPKLAAAMQTVSGRCLRAVQQLAALCLRRRAVVRICRNCSCCC